MPETLGPGPIGRDDRAHRQKTRLEGGFSLAVEPDQSAITCG